MQVAAYLVFSAVGVSMSCRRGQCGLMCSAAAWIASKAVEWGALLLAAGSGSSSRLCAGICGWVYSERVRACNK